MNPRPGRAFLGLGSNVGDRRGHLRGAVEFLRESVEVVQVSGLYETEPVGGPPGQGDYLNLVVEVAAGPTARELFELGRKAEEKAGRVRAERWGERTLDVDVLLVEGAPVDEEDLVVPHPRLWERRFVLEPLAEIAPDVVASGPGTPVLAGRVRRVGTLVGDERHPPPQSGAGT